MKRSIDIVRSEGNEKEICRQGDSDWIEKEDGIADWPEELRSFAPRFIRKEQHADRLFRWEENMGRQHENPLDLIASWMTVREALWEEVEPEWLSLRSWLKKIEPSRKIEVKRLRSLMLEQKDSLPFVPSKKSLHKALDTKLKLNLFRGYIHGSLTYRRIREKGFICWRKANKNGFRGTDVAPFLSPEEQPLDIVLHILKYSWNTAPARALAALQLLGCLEEVHSHTKVSVSAHAAISQKDLYRIIGSTEGMIKTGIARRAKARAKNLNIAGEAVVIHTEPPVRASSDPNFFLPRKRKKAQLFSLWNQGILLDEVGRYSLTPERIAMKIAQAAAQGLDLSQAIDAVG